MENKGLNPISPHQFIIKDIDYYIAKPFVEKWHYSNNIPKGKNIFFGLYRGLDLYAVIIYGWGVNPYQAKFLKVKNVFELKRMCRAEPRDDTFPLSRFIAISLKLLKKKYSVDCIVAFADPEYGHEGIVYKASGFILHGKTNPEWHLIDKNGIKRHRKYAYRHSQRNNITIAESRKILEVTRQITKPKYRWVKYLNKSLMR